MDRFIKYYDLSCHWLFKKPQYFMWWVDIIYLANYENNRFFINGTFIECNRGELAWSMVSLAERWKVDRQRVRTFLNILKKDFMITLKTNQRTTIITICNYNKYQTSKPANKPVTNQPLTTCQPALNHNIEILEVLETISTNVDIVGKPKNGHRFIKPTLEEVSGYCKERNNLVKPTKFVDYYESNGWKVGKNQMKDWKAAIRNWENSEQQQEKPRPRIII
jgi:hypothetical protein